MPDKIIKLGILVSKFTSYGLYCVALVKIFVLLINDWNDASEVLSGLGFAIMFPILSLVCLTTSIENA